MDECKRSGHIPAFGNWDYANELPITQYFESARQAGLIRHSSSCGDCDDLYVAKGGVGDLYAVEFNKPSLLRTVVPPRKTRSSGNRSCQHAKEQKKQVKLSDVTEPSKNQPLSPRQFPKQSDMHDHNPSTAAIARIPRRPPTTVKAVDEDLYKIPPDLLHTSKRKKMLGLFSRCLVPACMA